MHILNKITETIAEPRADLKEHAPRIETMTIPKEFIGAVQFSCYILCCELMIANQKSCQNRNGCAVLVQR